MDDIYIYAAEKREEAYLKNKERETKEAEQLNAKLEAAWGMADAIEETLRSGEAWIQYKLKPALTAWREAAESAEDTKPA